MRILIDLQSCQSGSRLGGIGRYSMALAKAMIRQGTGHEFLVLLNKQLSAEHEIRDQLRGLLPQHSILVFDVPPDIAEIHDDVARTRLAELVRERFIADVCPDILHVSSLIEGLGDDVVTSVGELFPASRTVVTLYDLIPFVEKERYLTNPVLENHYMRKIEHMRRAGMLFAISDFSRSEAIELCGIPGEKIINISSAVDETFKPRKVSEERREALFKRYRIHREFLMYTGSFDTRKNHAHLVEAFARLPADVRSGYQLLIIGNGWNGIYEDLRSLGRACGLANEDLLFTGRVGDDDLLDLYNLCKLFVFPSLREGFGLPVLEAMSCGVPTIGSNTTSIPEVLGLPDAMFDPSDISSISIKIHQALTDHRYRDELRAHALSYAKNFSWDITARKALDFLEARMMCSVSRPISKMNGDDKHGIETYKNFMTRITNIPKIENLADSFFLMAANALAANEIISNQSMSAEHLSLQIGWVTTWNTRCGIASYAHHLATNTKCTSKIFAPVEKMLLTQDGAEVERCWTSGFDDLTALNEAIDRSGVDVVAIQMNYGFFDFPSLSRLISSQKRSGRIVTITLHATVDPPSHVLNRRLAQLVPALNLCDAVLVHSLSDIANLNTIGVTENVALFPQGVVAHDTPYLSQRGKSGVFTIGTYGFFLPHKGLEQVIAAVALLRKKGIEINLEMINAEYPATVSAESIQHCKTLINELGLRDSVRMTTEYLDEQETLQRLANIDLVIFAYQGTSESSSAAVRMALAAGALVAVTPLTIFNDVNELALTLPGTTPEDLEKGILSAMEMTNINSHELAMLRQNSRRWVESHQFVHLARYFSNLIKQLAT